MLKTTKIGDILYFILFDVGWGVGVTVAQISEDNRRRQGQMILKLLGVRVLEY